MLGIAFPLSEVGLALTASLHLAVSFAPAAAGAPPDSCLLGGCQEELDRARKGIREGFPWM